MTAPWRFLHVLQQSVWGTSDKHDVSTAGSSPVFRELVLSYTFNFNILHNGWGVKDGTFFNTTLVGRKYLEINNIPILNLTIAIRCYKHSNEPTSYIKAREFLIISVSKRIYSIS